MPIYEYLCGACGHVLDALQKHSDEPLVHCPHCGEPQLKRQLSAPSFRLKGGGWYETDFKSDKRRNIAESESSAGGGKAKESPDGKPDVKPDAKTATAKPEKPAAAAKPASGKAGDVA
jgi:putative FmdB family regulatory protein